jgi:hypothetical protein
VSIVLVSSCVGSACSEDSETLIISSPESAAAAPRHRPGEPFGRAVLVLAHDAWGGFRTSIQVRRDNKQYSLEVQRSVCPKGWSQSVPKKDRAALEALVSALDPLTLPKQDPCTQGKKPAETTWLTESRLSGKAFERIRLFSDKENPACSDFQSAADSLMQMVGLICNASGCFRSDEFMTRNVTCP